MTAMTVSEPMGRHRWPLEPLLVACTYQAGRDPNSSDPRDGRMPYTTFAKWLRLCASGDRPYRTKAAREAVSRAARDGLNDTQADDWAIRAGYHPANVWGWDAWAAAGLDPYHVDHLLPAARAIAAEITATGQDMRKTDVIAALRNRGEAMPKPRATALWQRLCADLGRPARIRGRNRTTKEKPAA
jgi:hypothetical protein